jgi:hypothetical protein
VTPIMQWIAAILGVGGGGKFLFDVFTARSQNRKNRTDTAVTLINSAAGYADGLVKRLDDLQERSDKIDQKFDDFRRAQEARNRQQDILLLEHSRWDHKVVTVANANGIPLEEPPPLFLPEWNKT